jgi:hypothetical protein
MTRKLGKGDSGEHSARVGSDFANPTADAEIITN